MPIEYLSIEHFQEVVCEIIQECIKEEMLKEFSLAKEGTAGTISSTPSIASIETSSTSSTSGTKPTMSSKPGNDDAANNVMIPGTNLNINQALQSAAKETNFKKKIELAAKINAQIAGLKGLVKEESDEGSEEWRIIYWALSRSLKAVSEQYPALFDMFADKGMKGAEANKMVRALENVLDNMRQDLQMKQDVPAAKTRAAKAMAKSPLLKKFLPVELGGELASESMGESIKFPTMSGGKKISTREPMFPSLINRITNMVYYGNQSDEEILFDLGPELGENPKMVRWVKFIADMVRKGKDVIE